MILVIGLLSMLPISNAASVGAYNVIEGDGYVAATARCSCGSSSYNYGTGVFTDYCPGCGHHNCLYFEQGDYKGADYTSPEGLFACAVCDRDYCAKCGKIHDSSGIWLVRTSKPAPKPKAPENVAPADPVVAKGQFVFMGHFEVKQSHINHLKASL